ncbi:hypothetical protein [Sphingomicrobium lutaoense]|uniref:Uncharacterized protein n=1 Tax=Sphingomicrobium lutaoense TaxID=515949 RepID=A0A839YX55_9SPHN|nr:hypothetical protein [Sphingomicrobium lutaoense]MBB3763769.1 hypothetical protein [Sphingomicrobium lutaoense]
MKGIFWIAACGVAAVAGIAVQNGDTIGEAMDLAMDRTSFDMSIGDGDAPAPPAPPEPPRLSAEQESDIEAAVARLSEAQAALSAIRANGELSDEERRAALEAAQEERSEALAALREASAGDDPADQIARGVDGAIQGVLSAVEQSEARVERDGRVLEGEERREAIDEAKREVRAAIRELRDEIRN